MEKYLKYKNIHHNFICFTGIKYAGPNGKVNNMIKPFEAAKYDLIAISDSSLKGTSPLTVIKLYHAQLN